MSILGLVGIDKYLVLFIQRTQQYAVFGIVKSVHTVCPFSELNPLNFFA